MLLTLHIALPVDEALHVLYILNRWPACSPIPFTAKRYWRIVESYRDARGRPKVRVVRHLGNAQTLLNLLSQAPSRPLYAEQREFGAIAALRDIAQDLQVVETIDRHALKRRQGASVGQYMLLAALNRAVAPTSKCKLASVFAGFLRLSL